MLGRSGEDSGSPALPFLAPVRAAPWAAVSKGAPWKAALFAGVLVFGHRVISHLRSKDACDDV